MAKKMDWWGVVKSVGAGVIENVVPGGAAIIDLVNGFLPDAEKLPLDATGDQVRGAVESLPAEARGQLMLKELDVEMEEIRSWTSIQDSLAKADESGSSTRPKIANKMANVIVAEVCIFMPVLAWAIVTKDTEMVRVLGEAWPLLLALVATPTILLRAYFGMRTKEKQARYSAASGVPVDGGALGSLMGALGKRPGA